MGLRELGWDKPAVQDAYTQTFVYSDRRRETLSKMYVF